MDPQEDPEWSSASWEGGWVLGGGMEQCWTAYGPRTGVRRQRGKEGGGETNMSFLASNFQGHSETKNNPSYRK